MQKRALSDVVTVLLFILAAIMGVVIVWNFLQPLLKTAADFDTDQFTTQLSVPADSVYLDPESQELNLRIERGAGDGDVSGFLFGLEDPSGNVKTFRQNFTINPLEMFGFTVNYSDFPVDDVVSVTVTPIFRNNQTGKEAFGQPIVQPVKNKTAKFKLPSGLVAHWKFDGNYLDSSGNGLDGTLMGTSATQFIEGQKNEALQLTGGVSTYVQVIDNPLLNPSEITIIVWINPSQPSSATKIVTKSSLSTGWNLEYNSSGSWRFKSSSYQAGFLASSTINQWNQIAAVHGNGKIQIYKNAELQSEQTSVSVMSPATTNLAVGRSYTGAIDELMMFNRALNATEIQSIYNYYK